MGKNEVDANSVKTLRLQDSPLEVPVKRTHVPRVKLFHIMYALLY